jgi:hypothetical protein
MCIQSRLSAHGEWRYELIASDLDYDPHPSTDHNACVKVWSMGSGSCLQTFHFSFEGPVTIVRFILFQEADNAGGIPGFTVGTQGGYIIVLKLDKEQVRNTRVITKTVGLRVCRTEL